MHPNHRNQPPYSNRPHHRIASSNSKSKPLEVSPNTVLKYVMESYLLQARQRPIPEKVLEKEEELPENLKEEVVPVETEAQQQIITEKKFSETDLVPVNEEAEREVDENIPALPNSLEVTNGNLKDDVFVIATPGVLDQTQ